MADDLVVTGCAFEQVRYEQPFRKNVRMQFVSEKHLSKLLPFNHVIA